jgi:hypothetical protein
LAVRFWEIYEETKEQYRLRIVAGKEGMDTVISWVHMLEDETIVSRFHGEELAVTSGMKANQPNWLLSLVQEMAKAECAGIIINTGMYVMEIPEEVIAWCKEHQFPLLEMPWEISITSLIQTYCIRITEKGKYELQVGKAITRAIEGQGRVEEDRQLLGEIYDLKGTFKVLCLKVEKAMGDELIFRQSVLKLENVFGVWKGSKKIKISYSLIGVEDFLVLVLNNMEEAYMTEFPSLIFQSFSFFVAQDRFFIGIGPLVSNIENISVSYKRARTAMKMAVGTGKSIINFDEMGFYKILFSVDDTDILLNYANQILGPLDRYDKEHNADYLATLRSYITNDRSLMGVAESTFTHRNTVNYRIRNIKKILGSELKTAEDLFPFQVAFYIRDMYIQG